MTNMSYMIFTALVMLLQITNLSVSYDIISTGFTVLWSDTIPKWNVQLLVGIQSHLFPSQQGQADGNCLMKHKEKGILLERRCVCTFTELNDMWNK